MSRDGGCRSAWVIASEANKKVVQRDQGAQLLCGLNACDAPICVPRSLVMPVAQDQC